MITLEDLEEQEDRAARCAEATLPGEYLRELIALAKWSLEYGKPSLSAPTHEANDHNCQDWPPGAGCAGCRGDELRAEALARFPKEAQ